MKYATRLSTDALRHMKKAHQLRAIIRQEAHQPRRSSYTPPCGINSAAIPPAALDRIQHEFLSRIGSY